ncbi:MAG TPA: hypothetical protein VJ576_16615 [Rhodocyclaceae bacterium]|nr:hypothetical protein [Rhodocyclaceae bacterium]
MFRHRSTSPNRSLHWALAFSLALHGGILLLTRQPPQGGGRPPSRLDVTLAQRQPAAPVEAPPEPVEAVPAEAVAAVTPKPAPPAKAPRAAARRLAVDKPGGHAAPPPPRQWSAAERDEMSRFMGDLAVQAETHPSLAQRSLAMADDIGRRQVRLEEDETVTLERLPGSPPVDPFSLEMYLDGMLKKLNRSAAFVKNDPRTRGVRTAAVQIRLDPNGTLRSFRVLNAGDQLAEIDFIRSVVERAVPFAPFPNDMRKSAQSLAMVICILPAGSGTGGIGFTRNPGGRGC